MADFDKAVKVVLKNEGKYNNNPHDPGHATKYGISLRFLLLSGLDLNADNIIDIKDIICLNPFEAKRIYKSEWWDKYNYSLINDQIIATKIFDLAVNMGPYQQHKLVQRALNNIRKIYPKIDLQPIDGILGSNSRRALNYAISIEKQTQLLNAIKEEASKFYISIADKNPKLRIFLEGWLWRAKS